MNFYRNIFIWLTVLCGFAACKTKIPREVTRAVYYWKTNFDPSITEKEFYAAQKVDKIYVKYFDVDLDIISGKLMPIAKLTVNDSITFRTKNIVPVVFITYAAIRSLQLQDSAEIAKRIVSLQQMMDSVAGAGPHAELQIDCDWTKQTRETYFALLRSIKRINEGRMLTATLRLHQLKYVTSAGIPTVDRTMLMVYNMGNLKDANAANSILDNKALGEYAKFLESYPLDCDVALPLFDWYAWYRGDKFQGLMYDLPPGARDLGNKRYGVEAGFSIGNNDFQTGDIIRHETTDYQQIIDAEKMVLNYLQTRKLSVILFHSDSNLLKKFKPDELESFYSGVF